jgi:hypothetical protein
MSYPHRPPEHPSQFGQPQYWQPPPQAYGALPPPYYPQVPYGAPAPTGSGTVPHPGAVKAAALVAFVYVALRVIACLFLLVATIRLSMHDAGRAVPNYFDVSVGLAFIGLMTWGAVEASKGRTTKILFDTSLALLIVSIILVPTTVGPDRVSPAELTRAAAAVLSLIVSLTIIVLLGTAREPQPVRRVGWGWTVAGGIAIVLALALLGEIFEALGPSVSLFLAVQLLILGVLMILVRVWRGATLSIVILAGLFGIAEITVAIFGAFFISRCGYGR